MRFQGKSRHGFYPLPLSEAQRIRRFLLFPDQPSSALDPCVGDGMAFEAITTVPRCFATVSSLMPTAPNRPSSGFTT